MPRSHFKDYVLTSELTKHQREGINKALIAVTKKTKTKLTVLQSQRYCAAAASPQRPALGCLTQKNSLQDPREGRQMKGSRVGKTSFKLLCCLAS